MSEILEPTTLEIPGEKFSWIEVWIKVLTKPSTKTFESILRDPQASPHRAFWWVFLTVFIGETIQVLITAVMTGGENVIESFLLGIAPNFLFALMMLVEVSFMAWVVLGTSRKLFGHAGEYSSQVYAFAASVAPVYLIQSLISGFPTIQCLAILFIIYGFVLEIIGVMAVNRVSGLQAFVAYFISLFLVIIVVAIFTLCVSLVIDPSFLQELQNTSAQTIPFVF